MNRLRKIQKVSLLSLLVVLVLLAIFHFWLIAHAKNILSEIVRIQSNDKYHLQVKKVKYNYLYLRLEVQQPVLTSLDTSNNDKFEMHAQRIFIQLEKLWPLITGRQLLIDSIEMDQPYFSVTHQSNNTVLQLKRSFNLSLETEKVYQSIQSVLTTLKVSNFRINNGIFALNYSSQKNEPALQIKNIDFFIKGLKIDSTSISQNPNSYTDDVQVRIGGQTIQFPDSSKAIRFSSFRFVANTGNLEVDSCDISGGDANSATATFNLFTEKMRIHNIRLASPDSSDYNYIDSLFFTRPKVSFSIKINDSKKDSSKTISTALNRITSAAFGKILIRYVSINNVDFAIEVERKEKLSTFNFVQDSLEISNLGVGLSASMPVSADNIRFGVKEFVDYFRDSTYIVHFDSIRINNDQFSLFNFKMESTAKVKKGEQKIYIPVLQIEGIDWLQLLIQKRLMASNFTLNDPSISIVAAGNAKNKTLKKNNNIDSVLRQMFLISNIAINNGTINYAFSGSEYLKVKNINTDLSPNALPLSGSIASIQKIIRQFKTGELVYLKDGWKVVATNMVYGKGNSFSAATLDLTNPLNNLRIKANNVTVSGMSEDVKTNALNIGRLNWQNASIAIDISPEKTIRDNNKKTNLTLSIGAVNGGTTALNLRNNKTDVSAKISRFKTDGVAWVNGKPIELHDLFADGTAIDVDAEDTHIHIGKFLLKDQLPSFLDSVTASFPFNNKSITISIPEVNFETIVRQAILKQYTVNFLHILQPRVTVNLYTSQKDSVAKEKKPFPSIDLNNIEIADPEILFQKNIEQSPLQIQLGKASVSVNAIRTSDNREQITLKNIQLTSENFIINDKDSLHLFSANGKIKLRLEAFTLHATSSDSTGKWEMSDGGMDLSAMNLLNKNKAGLIDSFELASFQLRKLSLSEKYFNDPTLFFSSRPLVTLNNVDLSLKNEKNRFKVKGLNANYNSISLDSFSYHPQADKDVFMAAQAFQKDYINVETGAVSLKDINAGLWFKDSLIKIGTLLITGADLSAIRDKQLPLQTDIVKELPVNQVKKIPFKTYIDSVNVSNSKVVYHEVSEKTKQTGAIQFSRLQASIRNIKNYDFSPADSLRINASAFLMDEALLQLRFKESYQDSLAGFTVAVKVQPLDLQILNPFLLPVMSVKIKSGHADLLEMKAVAREYLSLGEMRFFYHKLKVEFLEGGNDEKKTLLTSLLTFAANNFVIKKNNSRRIGKVFYERSRNRSVFNYLVRMIASGGASSVGAKRNKKYNRMYENRIREFKLPEIDF
ncbi:MAG: hypothetical protein ABIN89_04925 [Chitinophagaceae bacterium]